MPFSVTKWSMVTLNFKLTLIQNRCARGERSGVHHQGHQRHKEGPGVPDQGEEEEDHDASLSHHRGNPRHLHGRKVAGVVLNISMRGSLNIMKNEKCPFLKLKRAKQSFELTSSARIASIYVMMYPNPYHS